MQAVQAHPKRRREKRSGGNWWVGREEGRRGREGRGGREGIDREKEGGRIGTEMGAQGSPKPERSGRDVLWVIGFNLPCTLADRTSGSDARGRHHQEVIVETSPTERKVNGETSPTVTEGERKVNGETSPAEKNVNET